MRKLSAEVGRGGTLTQTEIDVGFTDVPAVRGSATELALFLAEAKADGFKNNFGMPSLTRSVVSTSVSQTQVSDLLKALVVAANMMNKSSTLHHLRDTTTSMTLLDAEEVPGYLQWLRLVALAIAENQNVTRLVPGEELLRLATTLVDAQPDVAEKIIQNLLDSGAATRMGMKFEALTELADLHEKRAQHKNSRLDGGESSTKAFTSSTSRATASSSAEGAIQDHARTTTKREKNIFASSAAEGGESRQEAFAKLYLSLTREDVSNLKTAETVHFVKQRSMLSQDLLRSAGVHEAHKDLLRRASSTGSDYMTKQALQRGFQLG
ncbi:unnamed protein product, partial [Amoebophrya sp. A25]|eukprot:GSA25T00023219001.1